MHANDQRLSSIQAVFDYQPDALLAPGNDIPSFFPGVKVQVFHGFDSGKKGKYRIRGNFDLYCTQGPTTTRGFSQQKEAIRKPWFDVVETGWSKLDPLFQLSHEADEYRDDRPVILYAPTFSPKLRSTYALLDEITRLAMAKDWQWLVKFHPKVTKEEVDMYEAIEGDNVRVIYTDSVQLLLQAADVLVSDTSSIISEFALQGKAVVTFRNRKPESWMRNVIEAKDVAEKIELALSPDKATLAGIEQHCNDIHPYKDGRSAARVVDAVESLIDSEGRHLHKKPRNYFREWKLKKEFKSLGYKI